MTPAPDSDFLERFSEALVSEIKAEMGRRDLSNRGLAALIGENPQYVTSRLGAGNPRTRKRVDINVVDLAAIAGALDLDPLDLMRTADAKARAGVSSVTSLDERRRPPGVPAVPADVAAYDEDYPSGYDVQIAEQDAAAEAELTDPDGDESGA